MSILDNKYQIFYDKIKHQVPSHQIFTDELHTLVYGTDASFYRLIPKIVIKVDTAIQVQNIISLCYAMDLALTFRAGGTSLSGQALSDSILVITSRNFNAFSISKDHSFISLQPSITGEQANNILAPYGKKIGPDPASIQSAMIGGIVANNASGMCCGISQNSYKTIKSLKLIMADGTRLDTSNEASKIEFQSKHFQLLENIKNLSLTTKNDKELSALIVKKFKIKNTCGYCLNALIVL